ncbi:MAG: hypothetical protein P4L84_07955 [Isosphaeraceae bacterium]|nr:hypothetical protein [Isosphaeraceae bacterium]
MPLPRFRIRTLMITVAVVSLVLYGHHLWRLSRHYSDLAWRYERRAFGYQEEIAMSEDFFEYQRKLEWMRRPVFEGSIEQVRLQKTALWQFHLAERYLRAARRPWLPMPPDPPPPE